MPPTYRDSIFLVHHMSHLKGRDISLRQMRKATALSWDDSEKRNFSRRPVVWSTAPRIEIAVFSAHASVYQHKVLRNAV